MRINGSPGERATRLMEEIDRCGGLVTTFVALAIAKWMDPPAVSKLLRTLVRDGALEARRMPNGEKVWGTTRFWAASCGRKAYGARCFAPDTARWVPPPTFKHDNLAAAGCYIFGNTELVVPEHCAARYKQDGAICADGYFVRDLGGGKSLAVASEVETSPKTGSPGNHTKPWNWSNRLAPLMTDRCLGHGESAPELERGANCTLLIAPDGYARSIAKRIASANQGMPHGAWWMWLDADDPTADALQWVQGESAPRGDALRWPGLRSLHAGRPRNPRFQAMRAIGTEKRALLELVARIKGQCTEA